MIQILLNYRKELRLLIIITEYNTLSISKLYTFF